MSRLSEERQIWFCRLKVFSLMRIEMMFLVSIPLWLIFSFIGRISAFNQAQISSEFTLEYHCDKFGPIGCKCICNQGGMFVTPGTSLRISPGDIQKWTCELECLERRGTAGVIGHSYLTLCSYLCNQAPGATVRLE